MCIHLQWFENEKSALTKKALGGQDLSMREENRDYCQVWTNPKKVTEPECRGERKFKRCLDYFQCQNTGSSYLYGIYLILFLPTEKILITCDTRSFEIVCTIAEAFFSKIVHLFTLNHLCWNNFRNIKQSSLCCLGNQTSLISIALSNNEMFQTNRIILKTLQG